MTTPQETIERLGLTIRAEFVPFSKSRNAESEWQSLNWKVTLQRNGRDVLTTDYGAGIAHCPGYGAKVAPTAFQPHSYRNASGKPYAGTSSAYRFPTAGETLSQYREAIAKAECESGFPMEIDPYGRGPENVFKRKPKAPAIEPNPVDVIHSLVMDSSVLDSGTFEQWAAESGYETDSRKAESTYRACLEIALQLRADIGESGLEELRNAFQDY